MGGVRWAAIVSVLLTVGAGLAGVPAVAAPADYEQVVVPIDGLGEPWAVAVGFDGSVYVSDKTRVVRAVDGVSTPLPFDTYQMAVNYLAVDARGTVYAAGLTSRPQCQANPLLRRWPTGAAESTKPAMADYPYGLDADAAGNLYIGGLTRIRRIGPDSTWAQAEILPVTADKSSSLSGVAVDGVGDVYTTIHTYGGKAGSGTTDVVRLARGGAKQARLPFQGLGRDVKLAADRGNNVYAADPDHNRVLKLAPGAARAVVLPFHGLNKPRNVAVGPEGTVYVTDHNRRLLALLPVGTEPGSTPAVAGASGVAASPRGVRPASTCGQSHDSLAPA